MGPGRVRVPDLFLVATSKLDLVSVPLGHEQAGGRAVHLDHRVVGGGGAVHEDLELGTKLRQRQAETLGQLAEPGHDPDRLVFERARCLVEHDLTGWCDADEIGERAADVDSDAVPH